VKHAALLLPSLALALVVAPGCCFWRQQNPVKDSVVESRRYIQQGVNALGRSDLAEAERYCSQAVRACPDDAKARRHYADVLWALDRKQEALDQIDAALVNDENDVETRLRAAEMRLLAAKYDAALVDVDRVIDLDPKSAEAWALRGRTMRAKGQAKQALADFQRSLVYEPRRRDVLQHTAELYQELGEPHKSLSALQTWADTYGSGEEPADLFAAQGRTYMAMNRYGEAARSLQLARSRGAANPEVLAMLAEAEAAAGHPTAAYEAAQQALAMAPHDPRHQELLQRTAAAVPPPAAAIRR